MDISLLCGLSNVVTSSLQNESFNSNGKEKELNGESKFPETVKNGENQPLDPMEIQTNKLRETENDAIQTKELEHNFQNLDQSKHYEFVETISNSLVTQKQSEQLNNHEDSNIEGDSEGESAQMLIATSQDSITKENEEGTTSVEITNFSGGSENLEPMKEEKVEDSQIMSQSMGSMEEPLKNENEQQTELKTGETAGLKLKIKLTAPTEHHLPSKDELSLKIRLPRKKRQETNNLNLEELRKVQEEAAIRGEYCICGGPDNMGLMICCDVCGLWYVFFFFLLISTENLFDK
jgi:hypothetical protein